MALNLKKEQRKIHRVKSFFLSLLKRITLILLVLMGIGVLGWLVYRYVPAFQDSMDQILDFLIPFYQEYGFWNTGGLILLVLGGIWALIEEMDRKEKRRESMKESLK